MKLIRNSDVPQTIGRREIRIFGGCFPRVVDPVTSDGKSHSVLFCFLWSYVAHQPAVGYCYLF
jgi:hypothetical protein